MTDRNGPGTYCSFCGATSVKVTNTRNRDGYVYRRRRCLYGHFYTTREETIETGLPPGHGHLNRHLRAALSQRIDDILRSVPRRPRRPRPARAAR